MSAKPGVEMSILSSKGKAWEALRLQVLNRDGWICYYCDREADTVDHVLPKAAGGQDTLDNLVSACRSCNARKQDKTLVRITYYNPRYLPGYAGGRR